MAKCSVVGATYTTFLQILPRQTNINSVSGVGGIGGTVFVLSTQGTCSDQV